MLGEESSLTVGLVPAYPFRENIDETDESDISSTRRRRFAGWSSEA